MKFDPVRSDAIARFMESVPREVLNRRPMLHLLDSAIPPGSLRRFLPVAKAHKVSFYGFARPTYRLMRNDLLEEAAQAGCAMLQQLQGWQGRLAAEL